MNASGNDSTVIEPVAMPVWIRYFGAVSYLLVALLSLTVNGLLLATFVKTYSRFKTVSFFIIAWQMLACDLMGLVAQFTVVVPMTFAGKIVYPENLLHILGAFDTVSYNAALYFAFVLTLNRFTVFVWKRLDALLFQRPGIIRVVSATWALALTYVGLVNFVALCRKGFNTDGYYLQPVYLAGKFPLSSAINGTGGKISTYLPVLMLGLYAVLYAKLWFTTRYRWAGLRPERRKKSTNSVAKRETKFLVQSLLICAMFELENIAFLELPPLSKSFGGPTSYFLTFAQNWLVVGMTSLHAIIIFTFNSKVRIALKELLGREQKTKAVWVSSNLTSRV